MTEMMKAVRLHEFGGPDVLRYEDAARPSCRPARCLFAYMPRHQPTGLYLRDGYRALPPEWQPDPIFP